MNVRDLIHLIHVSDFVEIGLCQAVLQLPDRARQNGEGASSHNLRIVVLFVWATWSAQVLFARAVAEALNTVTRCSAALDKAMSGVAVE